MRIVDLIQLAFKSFRNRKSRIAFTVASVAIGVGAILFLVSLGFGLQKSLLERITTTDSLLTLDIASAQAEVIMITGDTLGDIADLESVEKVSAHAVFSSQVSRGNITSETNLNLIEPDWFSLSGVSPSIGRAFKEDENQRIVVNSSVAELFGLTVQDILNENLRFKVFIPNGDDSNMEIFETSQEFRVIGIIEEQGAPPQVYVKLGALTGLVVKEYQFAKVKVKNSAMLEPTRDILISQGFLVSALSDTISQANEIFKIIQIILGIFGVIALIVAAIGLVNTMTITLLQRINEIGIMRAIGASPRDIKRLFLSESIMTGFLGGLSGIVLGIIASQLFNMVINILAEILDGQKINLFHYPIWFMVFILFLSTLVGFLAGFWPARKASKLNPLEALRYK